MITTFEKRRGRPPEGRVAKGEPERIRDFPRVLVSMRPVTRSGLRIISQHENRAEWRVIDEALTLYFSELVNSAKATRATDSVMPG
jgi:hypothetical protein